MATAYSAHLLRLALLLGTLILVPSVGESQSPPCPRPALARLAGLAGRWSVNWRYLIDRELRVVDGAMATIDVAASGCAVRERLEGHLRGTPLAVTTVVAVTANDSLQRLYIDSMHGTPLLFNGSMIGDTTRFLWRQNVGSREQLVRHDYVAVTPASIVTETYMSPNGGVEWILVQLARYRRLP